MRIRGYLVLAASLAAGTLGFYVSASTATTLQILNSERGFRIVWARLIFEAGGSVMECPVTLEGTFSASTIRKRAGTPLGSVTAAAVASASCTGSSARFLTETLPWDMQYSSFAGTLPSIEQITVKLLRAAFAIRPNGSLTCLAQAESGHPLAGILNLSAGEGELLRRTTSFEVDRSTGIPLRGEGGLCTFGGEGHFSGNGSVSVMGETAPLRILLATPNISASPREIAFGRIAATELATRTVTLEFFTSMRVTNFQVTNGVAFAATDPGRCKGSEVTSGRRCTFTVAFLPPGERETEYRDELVIETSLGRLSVPITGGTL